MSGSQFLPDMNPLPPHHPLPLSLYFAGNHGESGGVDLSLISELYRSLFRIVPLFFVGCIAVLYAVRLKRFHLYLYMYIYGIHSNSQTQFSVSTWMSNYYFYFIELREQLILGLSKHPN